MITKSKRILSSLLAMLLLVTGLLPLSASAAEVTMDLSKCEVSWDYTLTDEEGNPFDAAYGVKASDNPFGHTVTPMYRKMHDYTAKRPGLSGNKSDWVYGQDYVYCFCIEHGVPLPNSGNYSGSDSASHGNKYEMLSDNQKDLLNLALAYGYPNCGGLASSKEANACYSATQLIVWQITLGFRTSPTELNDKSYPVSGYTGTMTEQYCRNKYFKKFYDAILSDMATHYTRPSFTAFSAGAAKTFEMDYANGKYSLTLTDTNNVLSKFYVSVSGGASVKINGNELTITSSKPINDAVSIKLNRKMPSTNHTTGFLIWSVPGKENANQDMVSGVKGENDPVPAYLKIQTAAGNMKIVKNAEDGKVDGVRFHISGNGIDKDVITKNGGEIQIENLRPGVYTVTEQSYDQYEPQETRRVTVVSGQTSTVTFNNTLKRGNLKVTKTSEDGLNEGIKFHLVGTSLSGLKVDEYAVTDSNGVAIFKDVLIGSGYVLSEVNTDDKYVIPDNQTAAVEWNKVTEKSFHNILKKWNAVVTKSDKETGTAQGDASLAGAVYGVYKGDQLIDTYTTDQNGQFSTDFYICGSDWSIKEISAGTGYLVDSTSYHVGAEPQRYTIEYNSTALDVLETVRKGKIAVIKHCDDGSTQIETPEAGAEFEVYLKFAGSYKAAKEAERDILVCDEFGFAETKELPYGVYTVKQTKGWEGKELMPAFDVFVNEDGEVYRYLINNATFRSLVEIVKKDIETGKVIPAAGIGFKVRNTDTDEFVVQHINYPTPMDIDTFYTDSIGKLMLPEPLDYGNYEIIEVQTCNGYVLSAEPVPFKVDGTQKVVTVEKHNIAQKGTITVSKSGEVFSSVTESDGIYQPVYSVEGLAGAVYEIYADEDIVTLDGTIRAKKGDLVATIETGADGSAASGLLYLGRYKIIEKKAPHGMVINTEPAYAELTYAGQEVEVTATSTDFFNERQKVRIELAKVLEQDEKFHLGMNQEILSVQFGLFAAEDIIAADGTVIPKDGLVEIVSCNENGKAVFVTDFPVGAALYVREISTDEHYIVSDKVYPVLFEYAGQDIETVYISVNGGESISNDIIRGTVVGKKIDEDGFAICGALFGLFRADETEFTEETALLTAESNEIGVFGFENVPFGNWVIRELKPAPAFVLNETLYPVTISENEEIVEIEIENRFITGSVQTTKVDAEYPENKLSGAVFEVYVDVNGNKVFDSDIDKLIGEMDEIEDGVYRMDGLRYNGYFLFEKSAPEGFLKDENYHYFEIRTDGETVIVENKAGVGFVNQPITGELEITKKDISDGKLLSDVGFRIKNENGEIVAEGYTDENGLAKFSLRYGKYTYQEFDCLDGYKPNDTEYPFEIKENGEIVKAEMTNEKIPVPEVPDVPQTGDSSNLGFWIGLGAIALGGLIACGIMYIKRKKDDDDE